MLRMSGLACALALMSAPALSAQRLHLPRRPSAASVLSAAPISRAICDGARLDCESGLGLTFSPAPDARAAFVRVSHTPCFNRDVGGGMDR